MYNQVLLCFENKTATFLGVAGIIIIDETCEVLCEFNLYDEKGYEFLYPQTIDEEDLIRAIDRDWKMIKHLTIQHKDINIHFKRDGYTLHIIPLLESWDT